MLIPSRLGNDDLDDAQALLVLTKLVQIVVDLLENERLIVLVKAPALKNFSDHMRALLID